MGYVAKEIIVADCETDPFNYTTDIQPFIWGVHSERGFNCFNEMHEFIEFIYQKECIVYFHNGGKFDFHFLLDYIEPFDKLLIINGRLSQFMIGAAEFRDSYNIFPMPLDAYQKDEFDYSILTKEKRDIPENRAKIIEYLKGDVRYLYELVSAFVEEYGRNLTIASSALKYWRNLYEVKNPKTSKDFFDTLRPFYYGGRVECFQKGIINKPFKSIDINSAYPTAMQFEHPYGDSLIYTDTLPDDEGEIQRSFITLNCISEGALPFRNEKGGLDFPNDSINREYTVTGWEYLTGIRLGKIHNVEITNVIELVDTIEFNAYVSHFFEKKTAAKNQKQNGKTSEIKQAGKRDELFAKLMLNSLYGKFALNVEKFKTNMLVPCKDIADEIEYEDFQFISFLGNELALMEKDVDENEIRDYLNIAVSASITGYVRAYMFEALSTVINPLYCDTDSIACESTGSLDLDPYRLGAWDLEGEFKCGGIAGKKLYAFEYETGGFKKACKGVRLEPEQILRIAAGETITSKNIAPTYSIRKEPYIMEREIKIT